MKLDDVAINEQIPQEQEEFVIPEKVQQEESGGGIDLSFLRAETGSGSIEDYLDHPMNFNNSKAIARMLRGAEGLFGSLRLAIIDIVLGGLEFAKERKAVN